MSDQKNQMPISVETLQPKEVFKEGGIESLLAQVKAYYVPKLDADTEEGREERRSMAYQIARSKTAVENLGKDYVADLKKVTAAIDERRRVWRNEMDAFGEEVRKPLTEYEEKEKARIEAHNTAIQKMRDAMNFDFEPDSAAIEERIKTVTEIGGRDYEEFKQQAETVRDNTLGRLSEKLAHQIKVEEQEKELADLREKQRQQEEKDREAERQRKADEDAKAKAQADVDAANKRAADAEAAAQKAKDDAAAELKRKQDAEAEEQKKRDADKEHRRTVNQNIIKAMTEECMLTDSAARAVITAIVNGKVPNTKITY